jgi:glycogen debranching enzyme
MNFSTVPPMGPFVEAWVRVRGGTHEAKAEARARFLVPLLAHLDASGLGHLPEVADGDPPHAPGGCPFQAWSVAEALRLDRLVLA